MIDLNKERKALAGNKIHNLHVCTLFDSEKNEYVASDVCDPSEDHIVESINLSWRMWQERAKAQQVPSQKYFSHDFNGDGFKYHDSLDEAQKEAEASLEWYRDKVADGHHVGDDGEFYELCYGVVIASADYTVDAVVSEDHHKNDEFTKYEVGTEILRLHFNKCNSESGAEQ
ncbi:hypothetical protein [Acinetobacter pittii]|uniref:hypothetical protein n=1 Tax=Acinetobacter pittii TaxID=48296 RepID=UPI00389289F8